MSAVGWHPGPQRAGFLNVHIFFFSRQGITSWLGAQDETARTLHGICTTSQGIIYSCSMTMPWRARAVCLLREGAVKAEEQVSLHRLGELAICWKVISIDR